MTTQQQQQKDMRSSKEQKTILRVSVSAGMSSYAEIENNYTHNLKVFFLYINWNDVLSSVFRFK
jgi:hypothetical protein